MAVKRAETDYARSVGHEVERKLVFHLRDYLEAGGSLAALGRPEELVRRMLAAVPTPSPWNELIGPFHTTAQVAELLGGISRQAVAERRRRRTVLALRTADGAWVYPSFQFDERNQLLAGLAEVLGCFDPESVDEWTVAGWLVARHQALGGETVVERLRRGGDLEAVLVLARDAARRFAG